MPRIVTEAEMATPREYTSNLDHVVNLEHTVREAMAALEKIGKNRWSTDGAIARGMLAAFKGKEP